MKEYIKPDVEYVKFDSETVTASTGAGSGSVGTEELSTPVENPWG